MTMQVNARLKDLQGTYQAKVAEAMEIRKGYEGKTDPMSHDDAVKFDALMDASDVLMVDIEREQKSAKHQAFNNDPAGAMIHPDGDNKGGDHPDLGDFDIQDILGIRPPGMSKSTKVTVKSTRSPMMKGYSQYLKHGPGILTNDNIEGIKEFKALQVDVDTLGGYLTAPQQFVAELIQRVDDQVFIRAMSNVITLTTGLSLGAPSLDTDLGDADWTSELATASQDDAMRVGKRELFPHPLAKRVLISNKLLNAPGIDAGALVNERMAYRFATAQENAFLTGSGSGQPLGVFTASADGISTARDVSTDNTTTAITADGLIECKYSLKAQYMAVAQWIFHRDAVKQIRKLKTGDGQYIWAPGITGGVPSTILDMPYNMSEFAPNTFTAALYVGILGDFSKYWIADALSLQVQRLIELYAVTNQVGFIGRLETDAMPVLEEAFARVKLAP